MCPTQSRKNRYVPNSTRVGRDSIRVRSMSRMANSVIAATSAPGTLSSRRTTEVRSAPVGAGGGPGGPTSTKRVRAFGSSTTPLGERREIPPLRRQRGAHRRVGAPAATSCAAAAFELAGTTRASGRFVGQPLPNLRGGDRKRRDGRDLCGRDAGPRDDAERDVEDVFGVDLQRAARGQAVERRQHRAFDRVLDRHARVVGGAGANGRKRGSRAVARHLFDGGPTPGTHPAAAICSSAASVKVPSGPR